jgi:hypothetical protein
MIMTVVTVLLVMMVVTPVDQKLAVTVNLISLITDLNVVIQQPMHLALIVLHWKVIMAGIAPVVTAH